MQNFTKHFHKISSLQLIHAVKITVASLAAIIAATLLHLDYTGSCAVIALITVAATRKETFRLSVKRILTFFITILISFLLYQLIGINYATFGLLMFLMALISYGLGMYGTISVNAVIATHILAESRLTAAFLVNETLLVLIGTLIAVLLNLYMPDETRKIRDAITMIEQKEPALLGQFQQCFAGQTTPGTLLTQIEDLRAEIQLAREYARRNEENILAAHADYYRKYMDMRSDQCRILEQMAYSLHAVTDWPEQAGALGRLFRQVSHTFHEYNNAENLLAEVSALRQELQEEQLPVTRTEFENRAILYHVLLQLKVFLEIKRSFVAGLTAEQIRIYWK